MTRETLQVAHCFRLDVSAFSNRIAVAICGIVAASLLANDAKALQQSSDYRSPTFRTQQLNEKIIRSSNFENSTGRNEYSSQRESHPKNTRQTAYTSHAGQPAHASPSGQQQAQDDVSVLFAKRLGESNQKRSEVTNANNRATRPTRAKQGATLALPAPGNNRKQETTGQPSRLNFGALGNMGMSLVVVLAAFFALSWILKRTGGKSRPNGVIPNQVVQILGRAPLNGRQMMQLVRLGDKVLLLAISPTGTESLGEIVDRDEVDAVTEICMAKNPARIRETFRETLLRVRQERRL